MPPKPTITIQFLESTTADYRRMHCERFRRMLATWGVTGVGVTQQRVKVFTPDTPLFIERNVPTQHMRGVANAETFFIKKAYKQNDYLGQQKGSES